MDGVAPRNAPAARDYHRRTGRGWPPPLGWARSWREPALDHRRWLWHRPVLYSMVESLLVGRLGVDVIALLALVGAVAVGEYLAGAVISVMLASGRALEGWAAGQARRELQALLERAPKSAHRYQDGGLVVVALDQVVPGDLLLVASGEVVPVDGSLVSASAVLDESALTGEPLPVERSLGDRVRSGVVNAGFPLDLRATTSAADSTYAGVVRLVAEAERSQAPVVRLADRYALGLPCRDPGCRRDRLVCRRCEPCRGRPGGGHTVSSHPGGARGPGLGALPCRQARSHRQGWRSPRTPGHLYDPADRQDGDHDRGAPGADRGRVRRVGPTDRILQLAASLDQVSPHVLASAVVQSALEQKCELSLPEEVEEIAGQGIRGTVAGHPVAVGKASWSGVTGTPTWARSARRKAHLDGALTVFVGIDGAPAGVLVFDDPTSTRRCPDPSLAPEERDRPHRDGHR